MRVVRELFRRAITPRNEAALFGLELAKVLAQHGFEEACIASFRIAFQEAVTNVSKYAGHGKVVVEEVEDERGNHALRARVIDYGPGISDIVQAMRSGFSTGRTLGAGLGTIFSQSDEVYLIPRTDGLTVELYKFLKSERNQCTYTANTTCGLFAQKVRPYTVFSECGDCGTAIEAEKGRVVFGLWDVEGHGSAQDFQTALFIRKYVRGLAHFPIRDILTVVNESIAHSAELKRGSIILGASDCEKGVLQWYQLGNVEASLLKADHTLERSGECPGVLGMEHINPHHMRVDIQEALGLILFTDGIDGSLLMKTVAGQLDKEADPYWLVDVLLRRCARKDDDAGILVMVNAK